MRGTADAAADNFRLVRGVAVGLSGFAAGAVSLVSAAAVAERARWALWIPVCLGLGIATYFSLNDEPALWLGPAFLLGTLAAVFCGRRRQVVLIAAWAATLVSIGFCAAQFRTVLVGAPVLERKIGPVWLEGQVMRAEVLTAGRRLWLKNLSVDGLALSATPARIRVKIQGGDPQTRPGDRVRIRAVLHPPAAPAAPGAFDFARRAYFQRLGAVGYAVRPPSLLRTSGRSTFAIRLQALRQFITREIHTALPGKTGALAAALMTGERGAIPDDVLAAMRDSGLAHLLAISGLHIGLVGGLLFFAVRLSLAIWERVALRVPIKKVAALAALAGSLGYLLVSGATLPTQRAFLMLCLVMLAILMDRLPISMNLVAWSAGVILLIAPESLMSVSFQMSFAAVTALVAVYETGIARRARQGETRGYLIRIRYYLAAVLLTTLVAGIATAPFALYHFNRFALYGILANLAAVPLTALWVMPCAIVAFILMPFGLAGLALNPMGWGIDSVIKVAETVQALPGAIVTIPSTPPLSLGLVALGGLWVCLWQTRWRFLGIIPILGGVLATTFVSMPDILVSETGKMVAVRQADGRLLFDRPTSGFVAETWMRRAGQDTSDSKNKRSFPRRCDAMGCVYRLKKQVIAQPYMSDALMDDCTVASILISRVPVRSWQCRGPKLVVDRFDLWRNGAHALWLDPAGIRVESVGGTGGSRPWSRYPRRYPNRSGRGPNTGG